MKAIMACDSNGGVAKNGTLPWTTNKEDMAWFRNNTKDSIVIMGSDTWHDPVMPRPLPNRVNIVVSSKLQLGADYTVSGTIDEIMDQLHSHGIFDMNKDIWVIGGPNVLNQFMPHITDMYLTVMYKNYKCDKSIDITQFSSWKKVFMKLNETCTFFIYKRNLNENMGK
jgi:dihydrofolate reductase